MSTPTCAPVRVILSSTANPTAIRNGRVGGACPPTDKTWSPKTQSSIWKRSSSAAACPVSLRPPAAAIGIWSDALSPRGAKTSSKALFGRQSTTIAATVRSITPMILAARQGAAFTERFYQTVANEKWDESAWRGRSLADVNRLRTDRATPGATIRDDHGGWLSFQHYDNLNRHHLGRSLPMLATEGGYWVGDDGDVPLSTYAQSAHGADAGGRPHVDGHQHALILPRPTISFASPSRCLPTSNWAAPAPGGNALPGTANAGTAADCPIVPRIACQPKVVRKWQGDGEHHLISLRGAVLNAHGEQSVVLERGGIQVASAILRRQQPFPARRPDARRVPVATGWHTDRTGSHLDSRPRET